MTPLRRWLVCILIACASVFIAACDEGGIGMSLPTSGARWGGPSGTGVIAGGPVYR